MKKKGKGIFWGGVGIAFLAVGICFVTKLTDPGYAYNKNKEFMEDSEIYDVLFFGNSHMANGVYPMELWHNYGIVSYNLGGFGNLLPATYWTMSDALDMSNPGLVVIDCHNLRSDGKMGQKEMLHAQIDCLPLKAKKLRMINDLVEEPKDRLEFIWDFAAYHDRWWDLDQADFEKNINIQKGAEIAVDVVPPDEMEEKPEETVEFDSMGVTYLCRMIEECRDRGIEVLLTYLPFPASEEDWQEALFVELLAEEYGISYINFLDLHVVDLETDCSDKNSHLNGSGGRKVTEYIGQYIERYYHIADHRGEAAYAGWDDDYRRYTDYKLDVMRNLQSLDKYLMMCSDPAFDYSVYVDGDADIWKQNDMYLPLLRNVSGGQTDMLSEAAASKNDYFLVVDNREESIQESMGGKSLFDVEEKDSAAVSITVVDRQDGAVVDHKRFSNRLDHQDGK